LWAGRAGALKREGKRLKKGKDLFAGARSAKEDKGFAGPPGMAGLVVMGDYAV